MSEKEWGEKLLQGTQSTLAGAKKNGTAITVTTQENAVKTIFNKRFTIPSDSDFLKHSVYPDELRKDFIVRLEFSSSEKVILRSRVTTSVYKLSNVSLEYNGIFDKNYAKMIGGLCAGTTLIPYAKVI